jgi:hypothetical protein
MWAAVRELAGIGEFLAIAQGLIGAYRRLVWFAFAALCWTLWTIRNKLTIEGSIIGKPADALYKMTIFMQQWRTLVKSKDRELLDRIRRLHSTLLAAEQQS